MAFFLNSSLNAQNLLIKQERIEIEKSPKYSTFVSKFPFLDSINFYEITYLSDSLMINGHLVSPKRSGDFPAIIYNRGGNREFGLNTLKKIVATGLAELASEGYVIAMTQYRGNGGSEGTEEFGGADVNDVLNLIDVMSEIENVDTSSIGMYGWSRGGIMTYSTLIQTNKIKAVVVGGGVSDSWDVLELRPGFEEHVYRELIPNYEENKSEELDKRSAIKWVDKFPKNVPILVLHGGSDGNVNPKQPLELSLKFNEFRIPHKLIIYEGDDHLLRNHREEAQLEIEHWFKRYLSEEESTPDMNYRISK